MDLGLTGKTALITGATSGIGLAIAQRLAQEGCRIAICGRTQAKLDNALATLPGSRGFIADIGKPADVATLVERTIEALGRIDVVVSNAGTHISGRIDDVAGDVVLRHFQTKVLGPWELARCWRRTCAGRAADASS